MSRTYDIVIIGSGIAGSISAAILAKHGLKTLILDAGQHPRFSIGEAMTPERPAPAPPRATLRDPRTGLHRQSRTDRPTHRIVRLRDQAGIQLRLARCRRGQRCRACRRPAAGRSGGPPVSPGHRLLRLAARAPARRERPPPHAHRRIRVPSRGCGHPSRRRRKPASSLCHRCRRAGSPLARQLGVRTTDGLATHTCSFFTHMLNVKAYEEVASNTDQSPIPCSRARSTTSSRRAGSGSSRSTTTPRVPTGYVAWASSTTV